MKPSPMAGSLLRIGVGVLLCAACFEAGRSYQRLSASAEAVPATDAVGELAEAGFVGPRLPAPDDTSATSAPGDPMGESGDIITPLNVRDPSALVMGPSYLSCPPPQAAEPAPQLAEPPYKEPKPKKLKEGRLLELLKKSDPKNAQPKRY